jgi:hypothetical protein
MDERDWVPVGVVAVSDAGVEVLETESDAVDEVVRKVVSVEVVREEIESVEDEDMIFRGERGWCDPGTCKLSGIKMMRSLWIVGGREDARRYQKLARGG